MRNLICTLSALLILGTASIANAAESKAVQTMSGILMNLKHMPSAEDKQALTKIAEDKATTADERTVAQALMNVQHTVGAADKPKLEAIVGDAKASGGVKALAGVLLSMKHFASDADKEKLTALSK
jgi:hypothetical protein